jgi:hypothetical protein
MRQKTNTMLVIASRGYKRAGHLPTRMTAPPMLQRRYSIEVSISPKGPTSHWTKDVSKEWEENKDTKVSFMATRGNNAAHHTKYYDPYIDINQILAAVHRIEEYELILPHVPALPLPNPLRYPHFIKRSAYRPPPNGDLYLSLGDGTLENRQFYSMVETFHKEAWMDDSILNMALEALRQFTNCNTHHIDIVNTNISQVCYMATIMNDLHETYYNHYRERLRDKRWILVPINDGVEGNFERGAGGSHWSLVILDCIQKCAFYYDSLYVGHDSRIQKTASTVTVGLLMILGETITRWFWNPQENSPNQLKNNRFKHDYGPCGPFVWDMCRLMINNIQHHQRSGSEEECSLELDSNFPRWFGDRFDSYLVRHEMQRLVASFKCKLDPSRLMEEHDQAALGGEHVILYEESLAVSGPPPQRFVEDNRAKRAALNDDNNNNNNNNEKRNSICLVSDSDDDILSDVITEPAEDITFDDEEVTREIFCEDSSNYCTCQQDKRRRNHHCSTDATNSFKMEAVRYIGGTSTATRVRDTTPEQPDDQNNANQQPTLKRCNSVESEDRLSQGEL